MRLIKYWAPQSCMKPWFHVKIKLLWPPCIADADITFLPCAFFYHLHTWCGLSANLGCRSETCCMRLAENIGRKNRHLGAIAQLCLAMSSQLRQVSTIEKKLVKQQYLQFQRVSRLGSVTAWHSSSGRQPNFAALNRGRHL